MAVERFGSLISTRQRPLAVERASPWHKLPFRLFYHWRYGYGHPDEDLLPVIDAAGDSLNVQLATLTPLLRGRAHDAALQIRKELDEELAKPIPDMSNLLGYEGRISALYPPSFAARRQWIVQERFARVSARSAYATWLYDRPDAAPTGDSEVPYGSWEAPVDQDAAAGGDLGRVASPAGASPPAAPPQPPQPPGGNDRPFDPEGDNPSPPLPPPPPSPSPSPPENGGFGSPGGGIGSARADTLTLLGYIHSNYLLGVAREKAVRDLKRWLLIRFWTFLGLFSVALLASFLLLEMAGQLRFWDLVLGISLIAAVGRIGATASIVRRLQVAVQGNVLAQDPLLELTALRTGKNGIELALLSSGVFALLLYALFATGVPERLGLADGVFPTMAGSQAERQEQDARRVALEVEQDRTERQLAERRSYLAGLTRSTAPSAASPVPEVEGLDLLQAGPGPDGTNPVTPPATGIAARSASADAIAEARAELRSLEAEHRVVVRRLASLDQQERAAPGACSQGSQCQWPPTTLAVALGFAGSADLFKMLIWAFLAGFAERLVPDVLDRISNGVSRDRGAPETVAIAAVQARSPALATAPAPRPPRSPPDPAGNDLNE